MITGFNTDVPHEGQVYHVQTEDRGSQEQPVLESLVYIGGTIVAKKRTPYADQLRQGASESAIASLLKKQHQVIIAAIKAGRIEDLIRHSAKEKATEPARPKPVTVPPQATQASVVVERPRIGAIHQAAPPPVAPTPVEPPVPSAPIASKPATPPPPAAKSVTGGLNLDEVISDYLKRSSEQGRLDLAVLTPNVFVAGKSIGLRVQVSQGAKPDPEAVVTVKIIGTAFKPQVFIGRVGPDGIASFSLALPAFTAGTAAIVIEAQSKKGRGELKHLIRRA